MTTTPDRHAAGERTGDHGDTDVRLPQQHGSDHTAAPAPAPDQSLGQALDRTRGQVLDRPRGQAPDHGGGPSRGAARAGAAPQVRDVPRWVRWTVLPLLVLVPLGYVIVSAEQSRVGGAAKEQLAAARELTQQMPRWSQRHIYQVPIPIGATNQAFLETNSWDTSVLYTQFTTTSVGLDHFLTWVGTSRNGLRAGHGALSAAEVEATGWDLSDPGPWSGITLRQPGDKPDLDIAVDLTYRDAPIVYVVSTINFQHGFGGG